jgi:hypothetical protein
MFNPILDVIIEIKERRGELKKEISKENGKKVREKED